MTSLRGTDVIWSQGSDFNMVRNMSKNGHIIIVIKDFLNIVKGKNKIGLMLNSNNSECLCVRKKTKTDVNS